MKRFQKPLRFVLCLLPVALVGGWCTSQMTLSTMDGALLEEAVRQLGSREALSALLVLQTLLYALVCGFFGYLLAEKLGLMRPFRFRRMETRRVLTRSVALGAVLSLDAWTFAVWVPELGEAYAGAGVFDAATWLASLLYGGVIEEVMLRLFLMSLLALALWKLGFRNREQAPKSALIAANILAALVFAAAHLPATVLSFGHLTPLLTLRCFLLNGAAGLLFGHVYRKDGIQYAMLSHMLFHLVSRTIWLIFLP